MTDKSFGDHMSRNVVKNPLLSTAVTGLSIEDLTHNAVLLPVSRSQEVITQSDQNVGPQVKALGYAEHASPINQSGDAKSVIHQSQAAHTPVSVNQNIKIEKRFENKDHAARDTLSKASVKSEDDFDVNEYFARLQGTRYVSAPHSTSIKEDTNPNLAEAEENLEEINLNEPERNLTESQGLTADIAQNFSQLPTVLPQVASAVFSSFSNMLSMKSREETPERAQYVKQEVVQQDNTVPLMSMPEVKEVAPPPKEPPIVGASNYRLPTKKKYAQIPGLTSGEAQQNPFSQNLPSYSQPPTSVTSYFVPSDAMTECQPAKNDFDKTKDGSDAFEFDTSAVLGVSINQSNVQKENIDKNVPPEDAKFNVPVDNTISMKETPKHVIGVDSELKTPTSGLNKQKDTYIFYNPNDYANIPIENKTNLNLNTTSVEQSIQHKPSINSHNIGSQNIQGFYSTPIPQRSSISPPSVYSSTTPNTSLVPNQQSQTQSSLTIIPPPPMFSNAPRRDSQSNLKSVLPPSVARRISSNHPFLKPQAQQVAALSEKIFVPTMPVESSALSSNAPLLTTSQASSASALFDPSKNVPMPNMSLFLTTSSSVPGLPTSSTLISEPPSPTVLPPNVSATPQMTAPPLTGYTTTEILPSSETKLPPPSPLSTSSFIQKPPSSLAPIFWPLSSQPLPQTSANINPAPMIFNPLSALPPQSEPGFPPIYSGNSFASAELNPPAGSLLHSHTETRSILNLNQSTDVTSEHFANMPTVKASINPLPISIPKIDPAMPPIAPPKAHIEPPKATGNTNFRLAKQKPKYYAGPIEGVGSISNNVKPVLEPVQPSSFQGAMFTPTVLQETVNQPLQTTNEPFDINKQSEIIYTPYELGKTQQQSRQETAFNTAFDLSRPTTDNYETSKQEGIGFGIIGSLKSKLSSIDINKIQNTVTTFFDPAYNETKTDESAKQDNPPYGQQTNFSNQPKTESNFEIFVSNNEMNQYSQLYGSQNPFQYQVPSYGPPQTFDQSYQYQTQVPCEQNEYYQSQEPFSFYQVDDQYIVAPYYNSNAHMNVYSQDYANIKKPELISPASDNINESINLKSEGNAQPDILDASVNIKQHFADDILNVTPSFPSQYNNDSSKSFFDKAIPHVEVKPKEVQLKQEVKPTNFVETGPKTVPIEADFIESNAEKILKTSVSQDSDTARELDETKALANALASFTLEDTKAQNFKFHKSSDDTQTAPTLDVSSTALLGLSTMLADKSKELSDLNSDAENSNSALKQIDTIFNRGSNASFFDDLGLEQTAEEDKTELDICETCREVDRPEEKEQELENLTDQLIENITSPIQLLNPVEVPLTEINNTLIDETSGIISQHLKEISHVTEETIETIQVQSATELLDDSALPSVARNYGWATDDSVKDLTNTAIMPDHDYNLANPNAIGFFGGANLLTQNIPQSAIAEFKTDVQFTGSEPVLVLPRQVSIPTAPPAEEETKSDETGIDVHSIEQDAKRDFPCYEEFVIEPSGKKDTKLENIEVIKDSEESSDVDSFTNRVERFKKMEEFNVEHIDLQNTTFNFTETTSPSLPMASYFDTGNYAVDTHLRNSVSSPSSVGVNVSSPIGVPPGFEVGSNKKRLETNVIDDGKDYTTANLPLNLGTQAKPNDNYQFPSATKSISEIDKPIRDHKSLSEITSFAETDHFLSDRNLRTQNKNKDSDIYKHIPMNLLKSLETSEIDLTGEEATSKNSPLSLFSNMEISDSDMLSKKTESSSLFDRLETAPPLFPKSDNLETHTFDSLNPMFSKGTVEKSHFLTKIRSDGVLSKSDITKTQLEQHEEIRPFKHEDIISGTDKNIDRDKDKKETTRMTLPDPINFFASTSITPAQQTDNSETSFSRLASYFASSTKSSDNKSFFELSQSQDHYRKDSKTLPEVTETSSIAQALDSTVKNFFDNPIKKESNSNNISVQTQEQYTANMNLIADLTAPQNIEFDPELNVKTINYFTLEHINYNKNENIGEPYVFTKPLKENLICINEKEKLNLNEINFDQNEELKNLNAELIVNNCQRCCDCNLGPITKIKNALYKNIFDSSFDVRQCMNNQSDGQREKCTMDSTDRGESSRHMVTLNIGEDLTQQNSQDGVTNSTENRQATEYTPVKHHWFYRVDIEEKSIWRGFSIVDSNALENAYLSPDLNEHTTVATDGGRYDVNVIGRLRTPVYWSDKPTLVRRCSWFYKGTSDPRYVPYTESDAEKLEEEYRRGITTGEWHRRLVLPNKELVVMHGAGVMVHFMQSAHTDAYTSPPMFARGKKVYRNPPPIHVVQDEPMKIDHLIFMVHGVGEHRHSKQKQAAMRPRVVRRGVDDTEIEDPEPTNMDHLLLLCHGVGSACDMRLRTVEQVVNDFRATSLQLLQSHYKTAYENGSVGRIEVLPISWHATLHSGATGVDTRLARITLDSIPKLRNFTNDTVLDVLFYTSPVFAQTILETVCTELNRIYQLFRSRNPSFCGDVSVGGHSLGSVILYDLLCHQPVPGVGSLPIYNKTYVNGISPTPPNLKYPILEFHPKALYALGSPIAIFETIRGVESLGMNFSLPTCKNFFNIFHPYDPIAYRIEPLINPCLRDVKAVLIPHHKGRKRMHLELKETIGRVSSDIKHKLVESIKSTWSNMWKWTPADNARLERVMEEESEKEQLNEDNRDNTSEPNANDIKITPEMLGRLNCGRRVDYVLQEAPFEMINEYLFAMTSHVCYWESEDTMLMILREIYDALGVEPDGTIPQQSMTVQREKTVKTDENSGPPADHPSTSRDT